MKANDTDRVELFPTMGFMTALKCVSLVQVSSITDLSEDDVEYLTADRLWLPSDRSRQRRCVEAIIYGAMDILAMPRFPAPVEYVAAAIMVYVHPINYQVACVVMEGCEFTEHVLNGVSVPVKAQHMFALILRMAANDNYALKARDAQIRTVLQTQLPK